MLIWIASRELKGFQSAEYRRHLLVESVSNCYFVSSVRYPTSTWAELPVWLQKASSVCGDSAVDFQDNYQIVCSILQVRIGVPDVFIVVVSKSE